jgi:hypothetical protein
MVAVELVTKDADFTMKISPPNAGRSGSGGEKASREARNIGKRQSMPFGEDFREQKKLRRQPQFFCEIKRGVRFARTPNEGMKM